jgi:hypothetical protein
VNLEPLILAFYVLKLELDLGPLTSEKSKKCIEEIDLG